MMITMVFLCLFSDLLGGNLRKIPFQKRKESSPPKVPICTSLMFLGSRWDLSESHSYSAMRIYIDQNTTINYDWHFN